MPGAGRYLVALAATLALEAPVYAGLLALACSTTARSGARSGVAVNLVSHPAAFLLAFPLALPLLGGPAALAAVEAGVVVLEASLIWAAMRRDAAVLLAASAVANGVSCAVGLALLS